MNNKLIESLEKLYVGMLEGKVPATEGEKEMAHRKLHALGVDSDCDNCDSNKRICDQ